MLSMNSRRAPPECAYQTWSRNSFFLPARPSLTHHQPAMAGLKKRSQENQELIDRLRRKEILCKGHKSKSLTGEKKEGLLAADCDMCFDSHKRSRNRLKKGSIKNPKDRRLAAELYPECFQGPDGTLVVSQQEPELTTKDTLIQRESVSREERKTDSDIKERGDSVMTKLVKDVDPSTGIIKSTTKQIVETKYEGNKTVHMVENITTHRKERIMTRVAEMKQTFLTFDARAKLNTTIEDDGLRP